MDGIPVLAFAGYSGAGKTTLIRRLIPVLRGYGLRLGVLKHDGHDFQPDLPGKDSQLFTQAGAEVSLICSGTKLACVEGRGLTLTQALGRIHDVDLILVEGFKDEALTQIGVRRAACGKDFPGPPGRYAAVVTDTPYPHPTPTFGFDDIQEVAQFIMEHRQDFTHFNDQGQAKMVDVGEKAPTRRTAVAGARVLVSRETLALIREGGMKKGDVLTVAQIAGVMGAKQTPSLIPMCHPVTVDGIDLSLRLDEGRCCVDITAAVTCDGRTGVEMEALTAAATAALTVYDMCKAVQRDMVITDVRLLEKTGGVHGDYHREEEK